VVEDDTAVLMMLAEVLRDQGYSVAAADTPEQALTLARTFRPHIGVIGTDRRGTFQRGWHLASGLRQQLPALPLIMVSTSDAAVAELGVTERGRLFDAALLKPFPIAELVAHIQRHILWDEPAGPSLALPLSRSTQSPMPANAFTSQGGQHDPGNP
jgi:DNA-binding response OmpR family regulator